MGWASVRVRAVVGVAAIVGGAGLGVVNATPAFAAGQSFTTLKAGYTQEIVGLLPHFAGGVAFAKDGDPWVDACAFSGSGLGRFDLQTTLPPQNGTSTLHPLTEVSSNAGCGLTNHPNGKLYSNTTGGVVALDAETAAQIGSAFGPGGNALGIAPDPITGNLVYVGSDGTLQQVDPDLTTTSVFSTALVGHSLDGIYFDPSGQFLFTADRGVNKVSIVKRDGSFVQSVSVGHDPDGMAFHAIGDQFVLTNNTDGTMTEIDFPGNDFTQPGVVSEFASGGFRGDLSQVGPDGCLYLTQDGVRFDDGTPGQGDSLVKICSGFSAPPGVAAPTTTTTTTPPTTLAAAAVTTTTKAPVAVAAELPRTGTNRTVPLALGGILVVFGGAMLASTQRRRLSRR